MPQGAQAVDFFGLLGDEPPAVSQHALPYSLKFDISGGPTGLTGSSKLLEPLQEASSLYRLRQNAPISGLSLVQRAASDLGPMLDALWGAGYYNARIEIEVAGHFLKLDQPPPAGAAAAAEAYRGRKPVPIQVAVKPGPLFRLRRIHITDARTGNPFPPAVLPPRAVKLAPGDPARAAGIRAARAALIDWFRGLGHPLAKATATKPVVYHDKRVMDLAIAIDPGPRAAFGAVHITGRSQVSPRVVRSHVYIAPGELYSPKKIADARQSILGGLPAISSVRIQEASHLDAKGRLPITVDVTDRKRHVVGFAARYSTLDGPDVKAYWQDRNLFGGGESLRFEGEAFLPPQTYSSFIDSLDNFGWSDLGGRFKASFVKPALAGTRNDLLLDTLIERNRTGGDQYGGYTARRNLASAAIRHRFSNTSSVQIGFVGEKGETSDTLGTIDYHLFGIPIAATYDSTDRRLDPTRGFRATASLAAYPSFFGSSVGLVEAKAEGSTYYAVDDDDRLVLAARAAVGSVSGAPLDEIPANHRFYAGGGGSVRGYRYQSLSPLDASGQVIGGRSLFTASFEARWRVTDTFGLVPFLDMGQAFRSELPDFSEPLRYAAGLGFRYYTAIGPIRVDVALPLNPRPGDAGWGLYFGIGQAF
ncbi:MAG TPA: BamA/TamA family outer membrane protein [Pseudolabrys sp.]|nr:BamA/TamA family outer membrane protein [Pseudolabrys sp.]